MIIIDGDATPNIAAIVALAKRYHHPVTLVANHHHVHETEGLTLVRADDGQDAVDYKVTALTTSGDCVITQDYGLAALVIPKGAHVIHPLGFIFTEANIDRYLAQRQLSLMTRKVSKRYPKHKKRTTRDTQTFLSKIEDYLKKVST